MIHKIARFSAYKTGVAKTQLHHLAGADPAFVKIPLSLRAFRGGGGNPAAHLFVSSLLPLLHRTFNASKLAVSLTVSAATLAVALAAPFVGIIADLRGRKKVIVPAIYMLGVVTLLSATAPSLNWLIF